MMSNEYITLTIMNKKARKKKINSSIQGLLLFDHLLGEVYMGKTTVKCTPTGNDWVRNSQGVVLIALVITILDFQQPTLGLC